MNKEILRLAIPNVISNLSVPLLSTVDTLLMGQLSALHLAAVGIATMIFNFFYWNFGFLRMGTTGMTAQAFGQNDARKYSLILYRSLLLAILIAILLLVLNEGILLISTNLLNVDNSYFDIVASYFKIRIIAAPATLSLYAIMGWYFGMQNAWVPMIVTIFLNILNIVISLYLVQILGWGIDGVAWGTVIAQYSGLLISILFLIKYKNQLVRPNYTDILDLIGLKQFLNINKDIFIRTICLTFAFAFLYSQSAKNGATTLAVMVVLLQFLNWMSYFIDGFAYAAESLVGKYYGSKNTIKLNQSVNYILSWGLLMAILFSAGYTYWGNTILHLFTNDNTVINEANNLMIWTIIMPMAGFLAYVWDGIFIGLTTSKHMRNSMIFSLIIYMLLFYSIPLNTLDWYWISFLIFLTSRGVIQTIQYYKYIKPKLPNLN